MAWADYRPFVGPINEATKARLRAIAAAGIAQGRTLGRLGQIGDSITNDADYFTRAVVDGETANETGHDYAPIRSWLAYSGAQPADANSFYAAHGKGTAWGNSPGWTLDKAILAGQPAAGVTTGDGTTPGNYGWVLVMFGTNDIGYPQWEVAPWQLAMRSFLQGYIDLGVIPVISTIPPEAAQPYGDRVGLANGALLALASELRIPWVDYEGLILHFQPQGWQGTLISADGVHPTGSTDGRGFSQVAQTTTDGYALRTKLALDMAERLRAIVFEDEPPDTTEPSAPSVSLTSLTGGETLTARVRKWIQWEATDNRGVTAVDIDLSTDGGVSYPTPIAACIANTGSCPWDVPWITSTSVRVRLTAYDGDYNASVASSTSDLSIVQNVSVPMLAALRFGIQVQPNPLRAAGAIGITLPHDASLRLDLVDVAGRAVQRLASGNFAAGQHTFEWDGRIAGNPARAGVYFVQASAEGRIVTRPWVVTR